LFCPTTILSYQHYINFQKRLKNFKISIKTSILKNFTSLNETDLLISTPFDVTKYKEKLNTNKVALVVLDEEQLFGVMFKEFLKEIFPQAHFLYTSATPIPRTFFLATTGIIDLSIINTPPPTYNTPQTIILTFSSKNHKLLLIQKIINSSNSKKIIIINNDIDELYEMWEIMSQLNLKISIIHSKLNSKEIEQTFIKFIQGKVDIILSTTIIQSGIDTPEFDIMIIDNSQMLGISQLYQLRGRITRSNNNPKCYILLDQKYTYTDSFERISIFEKEDLSNLEVVQKDLDLRGPGSILSKKQSGYIQEIGLIQFVKLINQYLNKEEKLPIIECEDKTYLPDSPMKNKIYRQLLTAKNIQELEYIKKEIIDIYGKELPEPTVNLLKVIEYRIKNKGKKTKIKVKIINGEVVEV
jgi:transcription-repair coupling factor (superfamily II helicase)